MYNFRLLHLEFQPVCRLYFVGLVGQFEKHVGLVFYLQVTVDDRATLRSVSLPFS